MKRLVLLGSFLALLEGQTGYADAFLNIGASPRSVSLGQAVAALPQHVGGYLVNPAATGFIPYPVLNGMWVNQFGLADYLALGVSVPWKTNYQWGVHGVILSVDGIPERPDLRLITDLETRRDSIRALVKRGFDTFSDREIALTINFTRNISRIIDPGWRFSPFQVRVPVGVNLKILHKRLYTLQGSGVGLDLGTMVLVNLEELLLYNWLGDLVIGVSLTNLAGTRIYWNSRKEDLIPMHWVTGVSYRQNFARWPVSITVFNQRNHLFPDERQTGIETILFRKISIRLGQANGFFNGGVGIQFRRKGRKLSLDYSFAGHVLGNAHRLGGWVGW
jgi:hypothetical protein